MRTVVSVLTIVILFAHAGLGCCAHHVHACGHTHDPVGFPADGTQDAAGFHSHTDASAKQAGTEHDQRDDCRGSKCDFGRLVNERVVRFCPVLDPSLALPTSLGQMPAADGQREQDQSTRGVLLRRIRLHLLNQVLLI